MMNTIGNRFVPLAGRVLLSAIFISSGVGKIMDWSGTSGYMASKGMPAIPFFLAMAIILELVGGISVLTGYKARLGALLLIIFIVPATIIFHDFWAVSGMERQMQVIMFLKNLAIIGGLLLVTSLGPTPLSLDNRGRTVGGKN